MVCLALFLEYHRRVLSGKLRGLSKEDARRRLVPSLTTLLGLVSHVAAVGPAGPFGPRRAPSSQIRPVRMPTCGTTGIRDARSWTILSDYD